MKYDKSNRFMWEEFEGDVGGEGGEASASSAPSFNPQDFAREFGSTFASEFSQQQNRQQEQKAPQMSEADMRKALKDFDIDDPFMERFGNVTTQKAALTEFKQKMFEHFDTVSQARLAQLEQNFQKQFQPVQSILQERQAQEQVSRFEKAYPTLANPKFSEMRMAIGQKLQASGAFHGKSESQAFDLLANSMADVAKEFNPEFSLGEKAQANGSVRSGNRITPTSSGSGAGGAGSGDGQNNQGKGVPKAVSFLPKIRN